MQPRAPHSPAKATSSPDPSRPIRSRAKYDPAHWFWIMSRRFPGCLFLSWKDALSESNRLNLEAYHKAERIRQHKERVSRSRVRKELPPVELPILY